MAADPKPQNNGFHNESCHGGMVLPHLTTEQLAQTQPLTTSHQLFVPVKEDRQTPVGLHEHAADVFSRDYKYQPSTWNGDYYGDTEKMAFNLYEVILKFEKYLLSRFVIVDKLLVFTNSFA